MVMDIIIQEEHGDQREKHLGGTWGWKEKEALAQHTEEEQLERTSPKPTEWDLLKCEWSAKWN